MSVAAAAFMYAAIATSTGALAFLTGQRASGRTPPEVAACYEHVALLESTARDLAALCKDAAKEGEGALEGLDELERARERLDEAIAGLRRGADAVV